MALDYTIPGGLAGTLQQQQDVLKTRGTRYRVAFSDGSDVVFVEADDIQLAPGFFVFAKLGRTVALYGTYNVSRVEMV